MADDSDALFGSTQGVPMSCTERLGEENDRITLVGLVFETAFGLRKSLLRSLDQELGIAGQSFDILVRLIRSPEGRLRMSDLAAQTGMSPSGLTRATDRLVDVRFLERVDCPSDRRGAFAVLTALGRERTEAALAIHREEIDEILNGVLTPEDEATLLRLMHKLRDRAQPHATQITDAPVPVTL